MKKLLIFVLTVGGFAQVPLTPVPAEVVPIPLTQLTEGERIMFQDLIRKSDEIYKAYDAEAAKANAALEKAKAVKAQVDKTLTDLKKVHGASNCGFTPTYLFTDCGKIISPVAAVPSPAVPLSIKPKAKAK